MGIPDKAHENQGVYITLEEMMQYEQSCSELSLLPKQPIRSFLHGARASKIRGRGVSFEEIRAYTQGDDVRSIDWNVTARLQKPFVRVYTEERERPVMIFLDQRQDMFFGSSLMTKSVAAASLAAHVAWMTHRAKDRIGAVIFNDQRIELIPVRHSLKHIAQLFSVIETCNQELSAIKPQQSNHEQLNIALNQLRQIVTHDALIVLVSDFAGINDETLTLIQELKNHNDVIAASIYDTILEKWPERGQLTVIQDDKQARFDLNNRRTSDTLRIHLRQRVIDMKKQVNRLGVPAFGISTSRPMHEQLREAFGQTGMQGGFGND